MIPSYSPRSDPKQTIIEYLNHTRSDATTISFIKAGNLAFHQLHAVKYEDPTGQWHTGICYVDQDESGHWSVSQTFFLFPRREHKGKLEHPDVGLTMSKKEVFRAWGPVIDNGFGVTRVRLTGSDDIVLEDSVEDGIVLFITEQQPQEPIVVELYNHAKVVVHRRIANAAKWRKS